MRALRLVAWMAWSAACGAATAQDLDNGRRLSERWCAACHQIDPAVGRSNRAPPFAAIAVKDKISAETIAKFLLLPHATMPNFPLSRKDADDIAAFIIGMRQ
ncbi:MAG TPA: c-type cytochrome [Bradyrhizobium sp.]|nr:c-type cytochrome [Bradyrhizobium sp.]